MVERPDPGHSAEDSREPSVDVRASVIQTKLSGLRQEVADCIRQDLRAESVLDGRRGYAYPNRILVRVVSEGQEREKIAVLEDVDPELHGEVDFYYSHIIAPTNKEFRSHKVPTDEPSDFQLLPLLDEKPIRLKETRAIISPNGEFEIIGIAISSRGEVVKTRITSDTLKSQLDDPNAQEDIRDVIDCLEGYVRDNRR